MLQSFDEKILANAISYLIDGQELYEASILLLCDLKTEEGGSSYSGSHVIYDISIELTGNRAVYEIMKNEEHPAPEAIRSAFKAVLPSGYYLDAIIPRVAFTNLDSDWRVKLLEAVQGKIALNQGIPYEDKPRYTWAYLFFRSTYEIAIAKELDKHVVLFLPNCMARFSQEKMNKEADFLVCSNGKWGVLEVDGEDYHLSPLQDHEKDRLFQIHGIRVTARYTGTQCITNPERVVMQFLGLLNKNG